VPTPTLRIAAGAGRIRVLGFNPDGGGPSGVTAIDLRSLKTSNVHYPDPRDEPQSIAFAARSAWITSAAQPGGPHQARPATDRG
jgi:hypothetical protein